MKFAFLFIIKTTNSLLINYEPAGRYKFKHHLNTSSYISIPKPSLQTGTKFTIENNDNNRQDILDKFVYVPPANLDNLSYYSNNRSSELSDGYKLVWSDEFNGDQLDMNKWEHEINCYGGGNNENQCYVKDDDVLRLEDGILVIEAHHVDGGVSLEGNDDCNAPEDAKQNGACTRVMPTKSARIRTKYNNGLKWKYGRFEIRAKVPIGNYLWPAFWMLSSNNEYGTWAASGEIDILEVRGQNPDELLQTLHYGGSWPNNVYTTNPYFKKGLSNDFHIFGIDWDEEHLKFYIDDKYLYTFNTNADWNKPGLNPQPYTSLGQPWDKEFHILLNLAVGGNFFPDGKFNPETDPQTWKQPFLVDYVRVYQKEG